MHLSLARVTKKRYHVRTSCIRKRNVISHIIASFFLCHQRKKDHMHAHAHLISSSLFLSSFAPYLSFLSSRSPFCFTPLHSAPFHSMPFLYSILIHALKPKLKVKLKLKLKLNLKPESNPTKRIFFYMSNKRIALQLDNDYFFPLFHPSSLYSFSLSLSSFIPFPTPYLPLKILTSAAVDF